MKKAERGLFQKVHDGDWWIRYVDSEGKYRREKVGRSWKAASDLLAKRRHQATIGEKLPELRSRGILFDEIADDAIAYVRARYSRPADDVARLEVAKEWFRGGRRKISRRQKLNPSFGQRRFRTIGLPRPSITT